VYGLPKEEVYHNYSLIGVNMFMCDIASDMLNIDNSFSQQAMLTKTCGITNNRPPPSNHPPGINYEVLWSGACTESCIQFVSEYYVNKYKAVKSTKVRAGTVPAQQVSPVESPHILTEMDKEHGIEKNPGLCT
jgi:hypothetical protein